MKGVRLDRELGWAGKCDECLEWWPLDVEFWQPYHGMRQCRACIREGARVRQSEARRNGTAAPRNKDAFREYQRRWYRENRERVAVQAHARYEASKGRAVLRLVDARAESARERTRRRKAEWNRQDRARRKTA